MKIFTNLSRFREQAKFSTWVYSITYNFCIDFLRRDKKSKDMFFVEKGSIFLIESLEIKASDLGEYLAKKNLGFRLLFSGKGVLVQENGVSKTNDFFYQEFEGR